jgi:hypothetical protein
VPIQRCPLCLNIKPVVKSHLIPQALYDYCRPPGGNPIAIRSDLVIESSRQVQDYLLCLDCEECLNEGGETWITPLLARREGPFPFYELLTKVAPDVVDGDLKGYATANNPDIYPDKLTHFAMGIFWKAAIHSWRGDTSEPSIDLGPYAEPIRKYLKGESGFPDRMALVIGVLPAPVKEISFHNPYRATSADYHLFLFYTLGIEYSLAVGKGVSAQLRESSFACHPARPILLFDFSHDIRAIVGQAMTTAHKAKNVQRWLQKSK